jgi:hypothetical protein
MRFAVWRCLRGAFRSASKIPSTNAAALASFQRGRSVLFRGLGTALPIASFSPYSVVARQQQQKWTPVWLRSACENNARASRLKCVREILDHLVAWERMASAS